MGLERGKRLVFPLWYNQILSNSQADGCIAEMFPPQLLAKVLHEHASTAFCVRLALFELLNEPIFVCIFGL